MARVWYTFGDWDDLSVSRRQPSVTYSTEYYRAVRRRVQRKKGDRLLCSTSAGDGRVSKRDMAIASEMNAQRHVTLPDVVLHD